MSKYVLIESRDPFESNDSHMVYSLAQEQVAAGHEVTVFLVQNGTFLARCGSKYEGHLVEMRTKGVRVLADDFSLKERAVRDLAEGVTPAKIEELVDLMLSAGTKTIWH